MQIYTNSVFFHQCKIFVSAALYTSVCIHNLKTELCMVTEGQQEDLFIKMGSYDNLARMAMINEYQELRREKNYEDFFLNFLKEKLEIESHWKKIGLV